MTIVLAYNILYIYIFITYIYTCNVLWTSSIRAHVFLSKVEPLKGAVTNFTGGLPMTQPHFELRQSFRKFPLHRQVLAGFVLEVNI